MISKGNFISHSWGFLSWGGTSVNVTHCLLLTLPSITLLQGRHMEREKCSLVSFFSLTLKQWFSKCGLQTSTSAQLRTCYKCKLLGPHQTYRIWSLGVRSEVWQLWFKHLEHCFSNFRVHRNHSQFRTLEKELSSGDIHFPVFLRQVFAFLRLNGI